MLEQLKAILHRSPLLYRAAQRAYYGALFCLERAGLGSRLHAWIWSHRASESFEALRESAMHPHRAMLISAVQTFMPLEDVFEVGCHSGPNLYRLARAFPGLRLKGIDLNRAFVEQGRAWMAEERLDNVVLEAASADALSRHPARSADVVIADAVLMYLGPDKIAAVLGDMRRIARKGIVLVDWTLPAADPRDHYWYDMHWVHNYPRLLLASAVPGAPVAMTKIPPEVWSGPGWEEFGAVIVVDLRGPS